MHLVWFRRDLRTLDNPALYHAAEDNVPTIGLYLRTPKTWQSHHMSHAQQHWIMDNLQILEDELKRIGIPLYVLERERFEDCPSTILDIVKAYDIKKLYFNKEYAWDEINRDRTVSEKLEAIDVEVNAYHDSCLVPPDHIRTKSDTPYSVFTPYKKQVYQLLLADESQLKPYRRPRKRAYPSVTIPKEEYYLPTVEQDISWLVPGEKNAHKTLTRFIENKIEKYDHDRDYPSLEGTSRLSPYLSIGVLSPRQCINAILNSQDADSLSVLLSQKGAACWVSELIWRDFYRMICHYYPRVSKHKPFKLNTQQLVWSNNETHYEAWCQGQTGVPIIDSAMRQLNQTAWMHNRLRMIVAMFLSKNLWIDWRKGEAYFASKLVDWDFASNNGGWQWCASTGTDAAPYFRIFNPITQSERFNPKGDFIRQYCPELKKLSDKRIHQPTTSDCKACGYPERLVDLKISRAKAIEQFKHLT